MNAPVVPPVGLENLSKLETRPKRRKAASAAAIAVAVAGGLAGRFVPLVLSRVIKTRRRRSMARTAWVVGGVGAGLLALAARWQLQRLFTPQPEHEVEAKHDDFEVRRYPSVRIAQTRVDEARWDAALDRGFRRLADFIFGDNDHGERIAMTAPVLGTGLDDGYRVSFILPDDANAQPLDVRIETKTIPPRRIAALRFNGGHDAANIEAHKRVLARRLKDNHLEPHGEVFFAGYDPPSTLPVLRRNELWVEIAERPVPSDRSLMS